MERNLEKALERADDIIETVQQQPPPARPASSGEKSLQEKLYDIYVEECEKEPEAEGLRSNVNLLEKLMKREALPCLVVNLYPENQGYSLMLKDKSGSFSETFQLPYQVEKLLKYLDAEELPSFLIDALENSPVNVFHNGCVIAEIRDFRQCSSIDPPEEPGPEPTTVSSTVPSLPYQTRHILLRPTMQTLVSDVESITSDNLQWTQEEKLEVESQLLLATAEPLCLDPSVAVTCTTNRLLFNEQKMMTDPMKQSFKRHASPFLDQQEIPSGCACPPDLATMIPFNKQPKLIPDDPSDLEIDGAHTWKPRFCELTVPSEMDMQTYVDEMASLPFDEVEPTVSAASEVKHDCMFDYDDDDLLWGMNSSTMTSLNDPLFSDDLFLSPEDKSDSHLYLPPMSLGDYSDDFMAGVNTEPKKTLDVCQEPIQSKASCPGVMPQGSSTSDHLPQPSQGKKPTATLVSSLVLEKKGGTPPPVLLAPITGQGSSAVSSNRPQAARDIPPAPKTTTVSQQTTGGRRNRVSTLPPAVQPNARPSETILKIQRPTNVTGVSVIHVVRSVSNLSSLVGSSTQALGCPSSAPAAEGNAPNSPPTEGQLPGPSSQRSVKPPMQLIINNTANPLIVKLPPGSVILHADVQEPSPGQPRQPQQRQPQQINVLISKQHQQPRDSVPSQTQPASSRGSNQQPLSLPAQQTSHLNTEQTGRLNTGKTIVIQQTHTSVICQVGSTQQGLRQNSRSHSFQLSANVVHQGQTQTQNVQLRIIPGIVNVSREAPKTSQGGHAAGKPSDRGPREPPTSPRS